MKQFFTVLQGIGILLVLFGIGSIESPSIIPITCIIGGLIVAFLGYRGEQNYVAY